MTQKNDSGDIDFGDVSRVRQQWHSGGKRNEPLPALAEVEGDEPRDDGGDEVQLFGRREQDD